MRTGESPLDRMLVRVRHSSIFQAITGLKALELARRLRQCFDIVMLDLWMPQVDGIQFISSLLAYVDIESLVPPIYALALKMVVTQFE